MNSIFLDPNNKFVVPISPHKRNLRLVHNKNQFYSNFGYSEIFNSIPCIFFETEICLFFTFIIFFFVINPTGNDQYNKYNIRFMASAPNKSIINCNYQQLEKNLIVLFVFIQQILFCNSCKIIRKKKCVSNFHLEFFTVMNICLYLIFF